MTSSDFLRRFFLLGLLGLLTACSGMRVVDSDVTTFSRWQGGVTGAPGTTYRFERLPSQQVQDAGPLGMSQDQLEAAAVKVLERYGLVYKPDAALLAVQLGQTSVVQPVGYGYGSGFYGGSGISLGTGTGGSFVGLSFPLMMYDPPPMYLRELSVLMRDSRTNAVVYESRARHSGIWADGRALLPAMLEAALSGFPNPPSSTRRVNVEIPR